MIGMMKEALVFFFSLSIPRKDRTGSPGGWYFPVFSPHAARRCDTAVCGEKLKGIILPRRYLRMKPILINLFNYLKPHHIVLLSIHWSNKRCSTCCTTHPSPVRESQEESPREQDDVWTFQLSKEGIKNNKVVSPKKNNPSDKEDRTPDFLPIARVIVSSGCPVVGRNIAADSARELTDGASLEEPTPHPIHCCAFREQDPEKKKTNTQEKIK